jgi:excisionase family DNA binding protein
MIDKNKLLTRKEAAAYLGVKEDTLAVWACNKRYDLSMIKVGRLVKYKQSHLDAFLKKRTIGGEEND